MSGRRDQQRLYLKEYFRKRRRVYGVLSQAEYDELAENAARHGRTVFRQILEESRAYRDNTYVPTREIEARIRELYRVLRNAGNNLNQLTKRQNAVSKLTGSVRTASVIRAMEDAVAEFVRRPWRIEGEDGSEDR